MLGGGCPRDQQAQQTHTPHLEKLPNPCGLRGLQVLVLVVSHLLYFHEACELGGNSREAHNLGAAGFSSAVELYFASGLTLGAALRAGGPTTPLSGSSFSRTNYRGWVWCWARLAQGKTLPNPWSPCGERGLSLSFQGLSTGKRLAQLSTGLALSPLPGGELVSRYQSPHTSSLW